jgi:hypothetical protein
MPLAIPGSVGRIGVGVELGVVAHVDVFEASQLALDLVQNPSKLATSEYSEAVAETSCAHVATTPSKISGIHDVVLG